MRKNKVRYWFAGMAVLSCLVVFEPRSDYGQERQRTASRTATAPNAPRPKPGPPAIPKVLLTKQEQAHCRLGVGDKMPAISLPQIGGSREAKLADLLGKKATVVVFWKSDRRMTQQVLRDMRRDVMDPF